MDTFLRVHLVHTIFRAYFRFLSLMHSQNVLMRQFSAHVNLFLLKITSFRPFSNGLSCPSKNAANMASTSSERLVCRSFERSTMKSSCLTICSSTENPTLTLPLFIAVHPVHNQKQAYSTLKSTGAHEWDRII